VTIFGKKQKKEEKTIAGEKKPLLVNREIT